MAAPTPKAVAPSGPVNESNEPVFAYVGGSYVLVEPGAPIPNAQPTPADATTKEV